MAFAKTQIICHGARASRIGERLVRQVWKYIKSTDFVKGNISENERKEMYQSLFLTSLISYPDDMEKINTSCDMVFQIILDEDRMDKIGFVEERIKGIPSITLVMGEANDEINSCSYISVEECEALDVFLDFFSVYTFPQEFGADFEELKPIFEHKGKISIEKGEGFNLCVIRKLSKYCACDNEIKGIEQEKGKYVLAGRIANENAIKIYSV